MAPLKKEQHKIKLAGEPSPLPLLLSMIGVPNSWIAKLPLKWLVSPPKFIGAFPDEQEKAGIVPGCPWYWADSMHDINCEVVWPKQFVDGMELDTPAYWGKVRGGLVVEKQLAMGGSEFPATKAGGSPDYYANLRSLAPSQFVSLLSSTASLIRISRRAPRSRSGSWN